MYKRIIIIARHFNVLNGGIGKYSENVYDMVSHHFKFKPVIIRKFSSLHENLFEYFIFNFIKVPMFLKKHKHFDLYHATSPLEATFLPKDKSMVTFHDIMPLISYKITPSNLIKKLVFYIAVKQAIKCKRIICVSEKTRDELLHYCKVDPDKITIIPNMVGDELSYAPHKKSNKIRLGFISKIDDERKRILEFIDLFKQIKDDNLEFHFAGIGRLFNKAKQAAKDDKRIHIYGRISDEQKEKFFTDLDLFVLPSSDEGFGIPVIEALKVGRPVLIFNDCTLPKEIRKLCYSEDFSVQGILEGIKKTQQDLKNNPDLPNQLTKKVEKYSADNIAEEIIKEYEKML